MAQTLAELRAQNALDEKKAAAGQTPKEPEILPVDDEDTLHGGEDLSGTADVVLVKDGDDIHEGEGDDTQAGGDGEDTLKGDDTASGDDWTKAEGEDTVEGGDKAKLPNEVAKAIRLKYSGRTKAAEDKAAQLERENAELREKLKNPAPAAKASDAPDRDEFATDAEYMAAVARHEVQAEFQKGQQQLLANQRRAELEQEAAEREAAVQEHYARAAALAEKSNIKPEVYKAADLEVRKAVQTIFGDAADAVVDELIMEAGKGSEMAIYFLGRNPTKRAEFLKTFDKNKKGLRALAYLTRLSATLMKPKPQESNAPEPPEEVSGDKMNKRSAADKQKAAWQKAHDQGDTQKAIDLRRAAKGKGVDVSGWI